MVATFCDDTAQYAGSFRFAIAVLAVGSAFVFDDQKLTLFIYLLILGYYHRNCSASCSKMHDLENQIICKDELIDRKVLELRDSEGKILQLTTSLSATRAALGTATDRADSLAHALSVAQDTNQQLTENLAMAQSTSTQLSVDLINTQERLEQIKVEHEAANQQLTDALTVAEVSNMRLIVDLSHNQERFDTMQAEHIIDINDLEDNLATESSLKKELALEVNALRLSNTQLTTEVQEQQKCKDTLECKICLSTQVDVVWSCGHVTCCGCAELIAISPGHVSRRSCPHCRQLGHFKKVYFT